MIKHIVMWTIRDGIEGRSKAESMAMLKSQLEELPELIREIKFFEVGFNSNQSDAAYDVILISHFASKKDLQTYQAHPEHVKVAAFVSTIRNKRAVVDFEV